jgi:hypothetical protein
MILLTIVENVGPVVAAQTPRHVSQRRFGLAVEAAAVVVVLLKKAKF